MCSQVFLWILECSLTSRVFISQYRVAVLYCFYKLFWSDKMYSGERQMLTPLHHLWMLPNLATEYSSYTKKEFKNVSDQIKMP
jgi:hypothetical protein